MNFGGKPFSRGNSKGKVLEEERERQARKVAGAAGVTAVALGVRSSEEEAGDTARLDPKSFKSHRLVLSGGLSVLIRIAP